MPDKNKRIFLSPPNLSGDELELVKDAFASNWIAPLGPHVDAFEKEISEYLGEKGALALASGTAAIHLALRLLDVGPKDRVFCSSLTFIASVTPVNFLGAEPVFIDSELSSWNMSPVALKKAFVEAEKNNTLPKAVIIVNLYGQTPHMGPIVDICEQYNVPIVEDAAESLGATYKGAQSGTFGKLGILSFNGNKIITTSGGGMLVSDNQELLDKARFWATQARDKAPWYQHSEIGYNYRMSNILAAIGRGQLKHLDDRIEAKRNVYRRYVESLGHIEGIDFMPEIENGRSTMWLTALTIDPKKCGTTNLEIMEKLGEENIESRPVWKPMHIQPVFEGNEYFTHFENQSACDDLFHNGLCLPSGSDLTKEQQDRVMTIVKETIRQ